MKPGNLNSGIIRRKKRYLRSSVLALRKRKLAKKALRKNGKRVVKVWGSEGNISRSEIRASLVKRV